MREKLKISEIFHKIRINREKNSIKTKKLNNILSWLENWDIFLKCCEFF